MYNFSIIIGNSLIQMYPTFSGTFAEKMRFSLSVFPYDFYAIFLLCMNFRNLWTNQDVVR